MQNIVIIRTHIADALSIKNAYRGKTVNMQINISGY